MSRKYSHKHGADKQSNYRYPHHAGNWRKRVAAKRVRLSIKVILRQLIK